MLGHGRWGYRRVGNFICYYFYKNVILVFCELYFAFYNGYSGQIFFPDWLPMLYNAFWTSWPCIFTYIFERDCDSAMSLKYPVLYKAGPKQVYFNFSIFWRWMLFAIFHGWACFFFPTLGIVGIKSLDGKTINHWFTACVSFTLCLHVVTYKLFLESYFWNFIVGVMGLISIMMYYGIAIMGSLHPIAIIFQPQINGIYFDIFLNRNVSLDVSVIRFSFCSC